MKKLLHIIPIIVIVISIIIGFNAGQKAKIKVSNFYVNAVNAVETTTKQNHPEQVFIPALSLVVDIENVGKADDGRMDVPQDENKAGWWTHGAKPGELGSMVLAGHIDRREGGAGIFFNLRDLNTGDEIRVRDKKGRVYVYKVTDKTIYNDENFPIEKVFAQKDKSRLNLITCSGFFDRTEENYVDRLVVYTELEEIIDSS